MIGTTSVVIQRPDEEGNWPQSERQEGHSDTTEVEEKIPRSRHNKKKSGSWKKNNDSPEVIEENSQQDSVVMESVDESGADKASEEE